MSRRRLGPRGSVLCTLLLVGSPQAATELPEPGFLEQYAATYRFRLGKPLQIRPTPDGSAVLFLRSGPRSFVRDLYELDLASGKERILLTAESILQGAEEQLTDEEKARRERQRLVAQGIASYRLSDSGDRVLVPLAGRLFVIERSSGAVRELVSTAGAPIDPQFSPDGTRVACVRDGELYVVDIASGTERRLTSDAGNGVTNGLAEFVAQEEMRRHHGFWWSPDSRLIAYQRTDTTGLERMSIADATHPERRPRSWPYPRPGKPNAKVRLGVLPVKGGSTTWVDWTWEDYEYLASVKWHKHAPLTVLLQNRQQTESRLLAVNVGDGSTSTLLIERDQDWLELDQSVPHWLPDGSAFLWITERRGAPQLELRERDGSLRHAVNSPDLGLRTLVHYLPASQEVVVLASADPTQSQVYRLPLDPADGAPRRLSHEPGIHSARFNRPGTVYVHTAYTLAGEQRWQVIGPNGAVRIRSHAESPGFRPNFELTTVGSDPALHAALIRPQDFDPQRTYPVIDHVYGGPTSVMVRADPQRYVFDQWIADHGYIVVSIDGRGTPHRGRNWHRTVKHDLIRIPLEDQARGLSLLGEKYRELDLSRVGIYGWSFGGYFSAMAVMRRPELFRVGIAGAPVVDWRDYDTHYTERYMGLPADNPAGYDAANVLTFAEDLSRPLLVIHGTADDNVYFLHSLKLADALFRAGKRFEFLPLAGLTHMVPDPLVTTRLYGRIMDFLETHLSSQPDTAAAAPPAEPEAADEP